MAFAGQEGEAINGLAGVREHFGEGPELEAYTALLKATRSFITVAELFFMSPDGSVQEAAANDQFAAMIAALVDHPEKAANIAEALVALVVHMKHGGTVEEWFEGVDE